MDKHTRDVIRWINVQRDKLGFGPVTDLRPGMPGNASGCPIALTIGGDSGYNITVYKDLFVFDVSSGESKTILRKTDTPKFVMEWINKFDSEKYPQYVWEVTT